jgi:phage-related protein
MQNGEEPLCGLRPMPSLGNGVVELKERDARTWYRLMYLTEVDGVIYVLHCFEKNSQIRTGATNRSSRKTERSQSGNHQEPGEG